jgi:hypothetical protein
VRSNSIFAIAPVAAFAVAIDISPFPPAKRGADYQSPAC